MSMLPIAWAGIIAFGIVMYVALDGFTLGTGMLLPFLSKQQRDIAVSVLMPTWDGNQTWLVLGGASLYGAFPMAFSALLPVLYIPIFIMVISLLFRGVAFEFRLKAKQQEQHKWDFIFAAAALVVTCCQGLVLGNFVEGFQISQIPYVVSVKGLVSPFVLTCAVSLMFGYLLLGSTRLIIKTTGDLQEKMFRYAKWFAIFVIAGMAIVSLWTPFVNELVRDRWFGGHNIYYLMILPYLTGIALFILFYSLHKRNELLPYWCSIIAFLCGYIGFIISIYPYIVPYKITVWQAASPSSTLLFLLVGAIIMIPLLLIYTGYSYYIFKGKVTKVLHY